jgi:hypothetical protein
VLRAIRIALTATIGAMNGSTKPGVHPMAAVDNVRLIGIAMLTFPIMVLAVLVFVMGETQATDPRQDVEFGSMIALVAVVYSFGALVAAGLMQGRMRALVRDLEDATQAEGEYARRSLVCLAILEGGMVFSAVAWFLTRTTFPSAIGVLLPLAAMLAFLPSRAAFRSLRETRSLP